MNNILCYLLYFQYTYDVRLIQRSNLEEYTNIV